MKVDELIPLMEKIEKEAILRSMEHIEGVCADLRGGDHTVCHDAWKIMIQAVADAE